MISGATEKNLMAIEERLERINEIAMELAKFESIVEIGPGAIQAMGKFILMHTSSIKGRIENERNYPEARYLTQEAFTEGRAI